MNLLKKRIDELGEELKSELTNIRVSWKKSLPSEIIENLNGKFQDKCQKYYVGIINWAIFKFYSILKVFTKYKKKL